MDLNKAIELNTESEQSLRKHKFTEHADALLLGINALLFYRKLKESDTGEIQGNYLGEDSIEDKQLSTDQVNRLKESPLGRQPKATLKVYEPPATTFTLQEAQMIAMTFYKCLNSHHDRQLRYTLLSFCGATPKQAQKWRDWSIKHFQLLFDYLFNPEPLAEGLVNNRLGLSEEGIKSVAVA